MNTKPYLQEPSEESLLEQKVHGDHINPPAVNCLMILSHTDLEHLLLLYINGATVKETLHIANAKSSGQVKSFLEMKLLMEIVSGTMETLVQ